MDMQQIVPNEIIEIIDIIILYTECPLYDLCLINKHYDKYAKEVKIVNNQNYPGLQNKHLQLLPNLKYLDLFDNQIITNSGIKDLINLTYLDLEDNKIITNKGIKI